MTHGQPVTFAIVRKVIPEALEQLDLPAHLIDDGSDRTYKGRMDGEQRWVALFAGITCSIDLLLAVVLVQRQGRAQTRPSVVPGA